MQMELKTTALAIDISGFLIEYINVVFGSILANK